MLPGDPGVLDVGGVDVDVPGGGARPGMTEELLDGEQAHARLVELAGAEVPQHMRGELLGPAWALRRAVTHTHRRQRLDDLLADADRWARTIPAAKVLSQIGSPFALTRSRL